MSFRHQPSTLPSLEAPMACRPWLPTTQESHGGACHVTLSAAWKPARKLRGTFEDPSIIGLIQGSQT